MTVHWGGNTDNMSALGAATKELGLRLIEDAAHAFGSVTPSTGESTAIVGGLDTLSDFTCFSFQAIKHVTTGDGGAITFRHKKDWNRSKPFKWFGIPRAERVEHILGHSSYDITEAGRKWQMNDIAASIGVTSFAGLETNLAGRRAAAEVYDELIPEITEASEEIDFPVRVRTSAGSAYWLYTILVKDPYRFSEKMRSKSIEVSNVHVRNDSYSVTDKYTNGRLDLAGLNFFSAHAMSIPIGPWISTDDARFIAKAALEFGS
jgi:dTDP-4-amino-4,6-dideoxygalactose transaminase